MKTGKSELFQQAARVTIVIPVFNQAALTERCLRALGDAGAEVVVVDDASTDDTPRHLAAYAGRLKVVRHSVNQGFAASCNHGASVAAGEHLLFLNNDTLPEPGWLEALVRYADAHTRAAVIGARLLYPDNTVQHAGVVICQDRYPRHIYTGFPAEHPAVTRSRRFQIVTAACMLVRRAAFVQEHGFDTAFRNGFEDVDLCLRLGEAGHEIHYCAESVLQHLESISPGRFKQDRENVARYRERWFGRVQPDDVKYYLEDGLLQFSYEGSFPIGIGVSPRLAILERGLRDSESEQLLAERAREVMGLRRENARLSAHLAAEFFDSAAAQYDRLRDRIRKTAELKTPEGATVLVISKGDPALLEMRGRHSYHFPQNAGGTYAGYHPADSAAAIAHLEALRADGAEFLLLPKTAFWWLEHYPEFERHLRTHYRVRAYEPETCLVFDLWPEAGGVLAATGEHPGWFASPGPLHVLPTGVGAVSNPK